MKHNWKEDIKEFLFNIFMTVVGFAFLVALMFFCIIAFGGPN